MELNQEEIRIKTIKAKKMMLLFSMLSIAMTFAGLTSAYIVSKSRPDWLKEFELPIVLTSKLMYTRIGEVFIKRIAKIIYPLKVQQKHLVE